jgi:hypothetical protein
MLNKEKLEQLMAILGELTEEQRAFLIEALSGPIREKEFFEKLGDVEEGKFEDFLKAVAAEMEDEVLAQPLSADELEAVAGGGKGGSQANDGISCSKTQQANCSREEKRSIYLDAFPNCAATVEDGSWCSTNDACVKVAVNYQGMTDCGKAWR